MKNVQYFLALSSFMWLCSPVKNTNIVDNGEQLRSDKISSNSLSENHSKGEVAIVNRMLPASDGRDISIETSMPLVSAGQEETKTDYNNIENMLKMYILERKILADKIDWLTEMIEEKLDRLIEEAGASEKELAQLKDETEEKMNELIRIARKKEKELMKAEEENSELVNALEDERKKNNELVNNLKEVMSTKEALLNRLNNEMKERSELVRLIKSLHLQLKEREGKEGMMSTKEELLNRLSNEINEKSELVRLIKNLQQELNEKENGKETISDILTGTVVKEADKVIKQVIGAAASKAISTLTGTGTGTGTGTTIKAIKQ